MFKMRCGIPNAYILDITVYKMHGAIDITMYKLHVSCILYIVISRM